MVPFLTDEDFNGRILRGLLLIHPDLDIIRVQDVDLSGIPDPDAAIPFCASRSTFRPPEPESRVMLDHLGELPPGSSKPKGFLSH